MRRRYSAGDVFSKLILIEKSEPYVSPNGGGQHSTWKCKCDCGNEAVVRQSDLNSGRTKSCGCGIVESGKSRAIHGHSAGGKRSPEHSSWTGMLTRCTNPKASLYDRYGGRGIKVCDRWMSFENFLEDMGLKPSPAHSIDRIDNNGNYEPSNCRWATPVEQRRNSTAGMVFLEHGGERLCLTDWAKRTGIKFETIWGRFCRGWSSEKIIETPLLNQ